MRPWMGASQPRLRSPYAGVRARDDGQSVYEFKLPNKATADQLIKLGFDLGDGLDQSQPGFVKATIVATPSEKAQLEAMGTRPSTRSRRRPTSTALRAERQATIDAEAAAKAALEGSAAKQSKSAAVGTVRAQHADYWEDAGGRWLSIEGTTTQAAVTCPPRSYSGPQLVASWYDAQGQQLGSGNLSALLDPDVTPRAYLYHVTRFRLGDASTIGTPMPAFVRIAAPNGDVATLAVKKWVGNGAPQYAAGFQKDFITHYVDPQEGYAKITALAGEFSNIAKVSDLPNKTPGYQRKSQTVLGIATPYTGSTRRRPRPSRPGGRPHVAGLGPGRRQRHDRADRQRRRDQGALERLVAGNAITVHAATDAAGAVTSTAAQVVAAINANADAAKLVTASLYRTNTGAGVVTAQPAPSALSDWLKAPPSYPRGPQTVKMLRIGDDVGKPQGSKVGVFIYCQEHAREWGTPLVCLETAERLLRNYATDPETKKPRRRPGHLHRPDDQRRRRRVLDVRLQLAAPQHGQLLRVEPDGQQRPVRPQQLGRRPQPQLLGRLLLRRLRRRRQQLHRRHVLRPVGVLRARDPQRAVRPVARTRTSSSR